MKPTWGMALVAAGLLLGCGSVARLDKGALVAYGVVGDPPRYNNLRLDLARHGGKGVPVFCLALGPQAPPMRSDALTEALVARYLPRFTIPAYWPETWKQRAREDQSYEGYGYFVTFREGQLRFLSLGTRQSDPVQPVTRPTTPARVGPADCRQLYSLPISRPQFEAIFGPPDRARRLREVYY